MQLHSGLSRAQQQGLTFLGAVTLLFSLCGVGQVRELNLGSSGDFQRYEKVWKLRFVAINLKRDQSTQIGPDVIVFFSSCAQVLT